MRYRVNVIVRRSGEAPDSKVRSHQLPDGFATVEAAVQAAEATLESDKERPGFVTIRVMDGLRAVYVSERAWMW